MKRRISFDVEYPGTMDWIDWGTMIRIGLGAVIDRSWSEDFHIEEIKVEEVE